LIDTANLQPFFDITKFILQMSEYQNVIGES